MKSWLSNFLPSDEYKEKKVLYFLSEGAILFFISIILIILCNKYFNLDIELALIFAAAIFLFYVCARYIIAGIEYTDVAAEREYKKELKLIRVRTIGFVAIFLVLYLVFVNVPASAAQWFELLGLLLSVSAVWFISSTLSLKRSYNKNKDLV